MRCNNMLLLVCVAFSICIITSATTEPEPVSTRSSEEERSRSAEDPSLREEAVQQLINQQLTTALLEEQSRDLTRANAEIEDLKQQMSDVRAEIQNLTSEHARCGCGYNQSQATTTEAPVILNEVCQPDKHWTIDDEYRLTSKGKAYRCDSDLEPGWYRFMVNGDSAVVPTSCVKKNSCSTSITLWLDLQGQALPALGQEVEGRACASWGNSCCMSKAPVSVVNCNTFYIYYLRFPGYDCAAAYCVQRQG